MKFDLLTGFVRDIRSARRAANEFERLNRMNTSELAADGATEFLFVLGQPRFVGSVQAITPS